MPRTKDEIEKDVKDGKLSLEQAVEEIAAINKKPPEFAVAEKSGWLSIYFDGMRFPCSMPVECAEDLFSDQHVERAKAFLKANAHRFTRKADRKKK